MGDRRTRSPVSRAASGEKLHWQRIDYPAGEASLERFWTKLTHLCDVLALAQQGSIRVVGQQFGSTQPAITSIREIKHERGVSPFERHARGIRLTKMGRAWAKARSKALFLPYPKQAA